MKQTAFFDAFQIAEHVFIMFCIEFTKQITNTILLFISKKIIKKLITEKIFIR